MTARYGTCNFHRRPQVDQPHTLRTGRYHGKTAGGMNSKPVSLTTCNSQLKAGISLGRPAPRVITETNTLTNPMWYYSANSTQQGPLEEAVIQQLIANGTITPVTLVWRDGMQEWQPASQSDLASCLTPAAASLTNPAGPPPMRTTPPQSVNPYQTPQTMGTYLQAGPATQMTWNQILWSFEGRIPRRQYWAGHGICLGVLLLVMLIASAINAATNKQLVSIVPIALVMIPYLWSSIALQVKRWHDRGKSGAWFCINFIPYIGGIWAFVECGCMRGTEGPNMYGQDPT